MALVTLVPGVAETAKGLHSNSAWVSGGPSPEPGAGVVLSPSEPAARRDSLVGLASMLSSPTDNKSVGIRFHVNDLSFNLCSLICTTA